METAQPVHGATRRASGVVRRMWQVFGALFAVVALWWGAFSVVTVLAHEERVETSSFPAEGLTSIEVRNSAGSVRVIGAETTEITVRTTISEGLRSTGVSEEIVGGALELRGSCPNYGSDWCRVDYEIEVPRALDVEIHADDGSIDVAGTAGTVDVDADNGSVELAGLSGPLTASNDNGRIEAVDLTSATVQASTDNGRVTLAFTAAPTTVVATSANGSVEVVVPDDGDAYRLDLDADNGDRTQSIRVDPDSDRSITLRSDNGNVTARTAP